MPRDASEDTASIAGIGGVKRVASLAITLAFVAMVALVVYRRRDDLAGLLDGPRSVLAIIGLLVVVGHFLNSAEFWVLYRAQGLAIGLRETWTLFLATQFGNLLPGQAGSLYRFRYLKVVHGFDYGRSGSNYGANLAITFASSAVVALVGLAALTATGGSVSPFLVAAVVLLAIGSLALLLLTLPELPRLQGAPGRAWTQFRVGWESIRGQHAVAGVVLLIDVAKYALVAWRFQIAFGLLDVDHSYAYFLVIAPAAGIAGAIAFTPGGLGVREAFVTAAAVGLGTDLDTGLLAATVDRGVMLLTALVLGSAGFAATRRRMTVINGQRSGHDWRREGPAADQPALGSQPGA